MSDRIRDISRSYRDNVLAKYSRSVGLFPIPEYPEYEKGSGNGMWSSVFEVILTTLRYFAPATFLTLFWGQQSFLFRVLRHVDIAIKSILYSSDEQRKLVLDWLEEAGPVKVEHLDTVWRHGWILCGVLDSALPGACAGHPPTRLSLKHAQSIADNYLGVEPIFSQQELESIDSLGKRQEWKLAQYLDRIRLAIQKISPPVSKAGSLRTSPEMPNLIMDYIARGSGLTAAQINNRMYFKIYPTVQQYVDPGEITVLIRGPKDIYGMTVIPPLLGKAQMIRQKLLGLQAPKTYTENVLPITQGAAYLRAYGKNDMNKTFYIPKTIYDIDIEVEVSTDYAKVGYIVPIEGKYNIYITSKGNQIVGSPYSVTASKNIVDILENNSFCLEDGEEIDIMDAKTERKVVLRIVDFVTEKMLLKENGTFEKISEHEANDLLSEDFTVKQKCHDQASIKNKEIEVQKRFKDASTKIKLMLYVCKVFKDVLNAKQINKSIIQNDIPDVVNSTFNENNSVNKGTIPQIIIPNSFTLLLQQEKIKTLLCNANEEKENDANDTPTLDQKERNDNYIIVDDTPIKIIIDEENSDPPSNHHTLEVERPKTPILKIITGSYDRPDSPFIDPNKDIDELDNADIENEFLNPFFIHEHRNTNFESPDINTHPATDFIIGAPVSLPPLLKAPSPEPDMDSIILASNLDEALYKYEMKIQSTKWEEHNDVKNTDYNKYEICKVDLSDEESNIMKLNSMENLTFHSTDSNFDDASQDSSETQSNSCGDYSLEEIRYNNKDIIKSKKETWDSAYVSIDDNNSSPEANEDTILIEIKNKPIVSFVQNNEENMGPAEREIWETCKSLGSEVPKIPEETKTCKWELKRPIFTPIIEESDRSMSTGLKESIEPYVQKDDDSVTLALAELNEILQEYPNSDFNSLNVEETERNDKELEYIVEQNTLNVESASEKLTDVIRQRKQYLEESISEVQQKVTESSSVSRGLPQVSTNILITTNEGVSKENTGKIHFGEECYENLVLERKKYWDERIRLIEEIKSQQKEHKKKKITSKQLRHNDSLSRRKGKQIVKNFLTAGEENVTQNKLVSDKDTSKNVSEEIPTTTDVKLVEKWKKFWDDKLIIDGEKLDSARPKTCKETVSPEAKIYDTVTTENIIMHQPTVTTITPKQVTYTNHKETNPPKQEIAEEVFKAFETSPKRFFGTSRKRIMNKIDSFLGKENTACEEEIVVEKPEYENGIVFNRISQFRRITSTEDISGTVKRRSICNVYKNVTNIDSLPETCSKINKNEFNKKNTADTNEKTDSTELNIEQNLAKNIIKRMNNNFKTNISANKSEKNSNRQNVEVQHKNVAINNTYSTINRKMTSQKLSASKSEMDIFSKINSGDPSDDLDKHKSCEELPKINVKNVISIYETVSKNSITQDVEAPKCRIRTLSMNDKLPQNLQEFTISNTGMAAEERQIICGDERTDKAPEAIHNNKNSEVNLMENKKKTADKYAKSKERLHRMETIITDIDIEIIDKIDEAATHNSLETTEEISSHDYKLRFKSAREFFKSFEELRMPEKKAEKLNECEIMLQTNIESPLTENRQQKRGKKKVKSHSLPSSEFEKIWSQMQVKKNDDDDKYVKISEKFNVDDLFNDVVGEGRLSRQGSFKGIPHKKAVLEIFRSMENISDKKMSSYEIAVSQLSEYAKQKNIKNAQTYLTEYPYLPTTDPSKYHSRIDSKASGLISRQELLNNKPRRNSVPDLRVNAKFIVNL